MSNLLLRLLSPARTAVSSINRQIPGAARLSSGGIYTPENNEPPIPEYRARSGETTELKRARLLYQSRKRGMTENGLLLSSFAAKYLNKLNEEELTLYDRLINKPTNDWEIYYWITGNKPTPEEYNHQIMDMLKDHAKNKDHDLRLTQPDLYT